MSYWKRLLSLIAVLGLVACGGGGSSAGTPGVGPKPSAEIADLVIVLSKSEISNAGNETVTATVTAVDANRNGVASVPVTVAINNNAVVTIDASSTDAAGVLKATIGIGADRTNRTLTVTVASGSITRTAQLTVVTAVGNPTPIADDLTLTLDAPSLTNGGSTTITATVTAVDRNRNVVSGIPITFNVDANATALVSGSVTNGTGQVTAQIGIGADRTNRVVTVTATSGSLVRTASFAVTGARLTLSASPLVVAGSPGNIVEYTLVDFNAAAMPNQVISVTGNGLPAVTGKTDLNGKFRYTYAAPSTAGSITIVATAAGDQSTHTVTVSAASSAIEPASEAPQSASITPTPSVVTVNAVGSTTHQTELRVLFVGANNKPIPRMRVRFDLAGNLTNSDGQVSWVGAYAYSDENGIARGTFTPGQRSSPTNGVTVRACYDRADFVSGSGGACNGVAQATTATLTVAAEALAVSIGHGNEIAQGRDNLTYIQKFVVMVTDAAGYAKADVNITPSIDLDGYFKGVWRLIFVGSTERWVQFPSLADTERYAWTGTAWARTESADKMCPNEDQNRNGVREDMAGRQEDMNGNLVLDPRKSDVAITMVGSPRTDQNGLAVMQIEYPQTHGSWVRFTITATASGVSGTEVRARASGVLPVLAAHAANKDASPPFVESPYGTSTVCTNSN